MKASALALLLLCSPALAATPRNALLDVSADVLEPGESQVNLFWGQYSRGILPGVQVSSHLTPILLTLLNVSAKAQVLNRPELRVSVEGGAYWLAAGRLANINAFAFPLALRGSVPLSDNLQLNLGAGFQRLVLDAEKASLNRNLLHVETSLVRSDANGAFMLLAKAPLLNLQRVRAESVLGNQILEGTLALDDVSSWSVMLARDQLFDKSTHVRFGLGYRHRPGIIIVESLGPVMVTFDMYWR
jgi:hypothetical protein